MIFAFPPFSAPVLPFLGLAPLFLFFARPRPVSELILGSTCFAVPYFLGNIYWLFFLTQYTPAGAFGALGALVLHFGTFVFFAVGMNVVGFTRVVPLAVSAPVLWTVSEHARAYGDFYFPWVSVGYSLSDWPRLVQHADLIGVYGVSFWLALINALVAMTLGTGRTVRYRLATSIVALVVLVAPLAYGTSRWSRVEEEASNAPHLRVAVLQPNVRQELKWNPAAARQNVERVNLAIERAEGMAPDLVVGPEACLPLIVPEGAASLPSEIRPGNHPVLLGVVRGAGGTVEVRSAGRRLRQYREHFNSAILAGPDRTILGIHDKQYLVPVTEQIPYKRVFGLFLPFMRSQFGRFVAAEDLHLLFLPRGSSEVPFGTLICYESLFPGLVREMVLRDARFLANMTNDAWFGRSTMSRQHLGFLVFRAIETRRSVVRSANTGVSAFVDPLGRVTNRTGLFEETVVDGAIPLMETRTFYTRWGDLVLWLCYAGCGVMFAAAGYVYRRGRRIERESP
jgi:apolipoprotein N-acyltransferase